MREDQSRPPPRADTVAPSFWRLAFSWRVCRVGARTSLIVGTSLNLINQWYAIVYDWRLISWLSLGLNFVVPYLVATYGAISILRTKGPH